ncbi:hypothetical protein LCGC14_2358960 [marine sediment metagenome]|uniref:BppU N-terminal domain-containing protein n=1 Tax=marine sediment metagenome TaxID=412755 RepID=A0A0F9CUG1_9ZZZZ
MANEIEVFRADDTTLTITFTDSAGTAIDITGYTVWFIVKEPPSGGDYDITAEGAIAVVGIKELPVTTGTDGIQSGGCTTITFADGVAILGDWIDLISDGVKWFVIGHVRTTLAITLA